MMTPWEWFALGCIPAPFIIAFLIDVWKYHYG